MQETEYTDNIGDKTDLGTILEIGSEVYVIQTDIIDSLFDYSRKEFVYFSRVITVAKWRVYKIDN